MGTPIVVCGAFDRHNFGDLLFPHLAQALLPGAELICTGLAANDLRPYGGHQVRTLAEVAAAFGDRPLRVLQLGGELLTCSAWQAAVMLLPPAQVQATVAWLARRPATRRRWLRERLGRDDRAPYLLARDALPNVERLVVAGVGGVGLAHCPAPMRAEVLAKLAAADAVAVRDVRTLAALQAAGVDTHLLPDPAVTVAALCGPRISRHGRGGEPAAVRRAWPQGYVALQLSAAFGADATLDVLGRELERLHAASGFGVVLFRAGAAPWHDDATVLQRLAARLPAGRAGLFQSLHLWDLCALIAGARLVVASSLHARIVALACARPRVSLRPPGDAGQARKLAATIETWDATVAAGLVAPAALAAAAHAASAVPAPTLRQQADEALAAWTSGWDAIGSMLR